MHPGLSHDDVRKVARLARLALTPEQIEPARAALAAVLEYVERIKAVDLTAVEPLFSPTDQEATARDDAALAPHTGHAHLTSHAFLSGAPATYQGFLRVPKVIGPGSADAGGSA
ncbi:MAG: Asp-tRNA(Asn)/Glu-tRNA(Gln) amidotransferase subunit GatC [Phycisphaerales bacterium]